MDIRQRDYFDDTTITTSPKFRSYRRGLTISSILILTILLGGLEFDSVTSSAIGLKVTRAEGMHVAVWAIFLYYFYCFRISLRLLIWQIDCAKGHTGIQDYAKWLLDTYCARAIDSVLDRPRALDDPELVRESRTQMMGFQFMTGLELRRYVRIPDEETFNRLAKSEFFEKSGGEDGWLRFSYQMTEGDCHEFERRRGLSYASDRLAQFEARVPFLLAVFVLATGILLYGSWFFFPETRIGQIVPL